MLKSFVTRPVTTTVFVLFFVVLGVTSYWKLNMREFPKVDLPIVTVTVVYPGATPEEVEKQVVKKIEDAVSEVSEIKKMKSNAYDSVGVVMLEFLLKADSNIKSIEVKDKVDAIISDLPSSIQKPIISKVDPMAKPVVDLVLYAKDADLRRLYEYSDKVLRNKISTIEGVAKVNILGGKERQINVLLDPNLMNEKFITIQQIIQTIKSQNISIPSGTLDISSNSFGVRLLGELQNIDDIRNLTLSTVEGRKFLLKDVAVIEDSYKKIEKISRFNGKEAIRLSVINTNDGNPIKIAKEVRNRLGTLNESLPDQMKLEIATDYTKSISEEISDTNISIGIGIALTVLILLIFTGSIKSTFISSIVIPSSIVSTFFLMEKSGYTVNIMTLLAIATALGTLVANAIVILESVIQKLEQGIDSVTAAIEGVNDVKIPIFASVGTNIVVFTPIAFMDGAIGKYMLEFGMTVVFLTIFSLLASFTLTPMLCALILRPHKQDRSDRTFLERKSDEFVDFSLNEMRVVFDTMFKFPKSTIAFSVLIFGLMVSFASQIGEEFEPKYDKNQIIINVEMPENTKIDETLSVAKSIENFAEKLKYKTNISTVVGTNGVANAEIIIDLVDKRERDISDIEMIQNLIPKLAKIPDAAISLYRGRPQAGGNDMDDIVINIAGDNFNDTLGNAKTLKEKLAKTKYFESLRLSSKKPGTELQFEPDKKKMEEFNTMNAQVGMTLRSSIYGDDSNIYKENGEEYDINIKLRDQFVSFPTDINAITILTRKGIIPIKELGRVTTAVASSPIKRREKERVVSVSGNVSNITTGEVQRKILPILESISSKGNGRYYYAGQDEMKTESESELMKAFVLAAILTFMVLAAILNSWLHPFTIASSIVTSIGGVILSLYIFNQSFNVATLLSLVMLVGLVVNNSIMLIEETIKFQIMNNDVIDSLWLAIKSRFKMIMMTSLAIIFATLPQLFAALEFKASMGAVIIGGVAASIFYTFVLTPVVYWYFERIRKSFTLKVSSSSN